ncbi:MAG: lipoyl domain-containing protein [Eudoraea sp.]|uniref:lipoyl domain-containing protein n=1 Tax=Eudoraea sp. TaxID=1979955 RepID=UPI003C75DA2D
MGEDAESSIALWYKEPGDSFEEGETLVQVQTEKVAFKFPATLSLCIMSKYMLLSATFGLPPRQIINPVNSIYFIIAIISG